MVKRRAESFHRTDGVLHPDNDTCKLCQEGVGTLLCFQEQLSTRKKGGNVVSRSCSSWSLLQEFRKPNHEKQTKAAESNLKMSCRALKVVKLHSSFPPRFFFFKCTASKL